MSTCCFLRVLGFSSLLAAGSCDRSPPAAPAPEAGSRPAGAATVPKFTDVLTASGITFRHHFLDTETGTTFKINPYDHGSGVSIADVNGDGLDDIYLLDFLGPNALYINKGNLVFEDIASRSGVDVARALSVGAAFGDYDNDGDQDLYVTTYRGGNHLFRNRGDGTFEDVTKVAGVGYNGHSSAATWFDYDLDGNLDIYVSNIGKFTTETISEEANYFYSGVRLPFEDLATNPGRRVTGEADILYRNSGNGTFTDATGASGIRSDGWNGDATVADMDLDGDLDLYVSNMFGENHLYRNKGDGTFEDITQSALKRTSWGGMGARFFDGNGDEWPDLYVVDMHSDMWVTPTNPGSFDPIRKYNSPLGTKLKGGKVIASLEESVTPTTVFGNTYFEGTGAGSFVERSDAAGLETWWPWGITVGDYNNDGWEDIFVPSGMGFPFFYWPNHLFINQGKGMYREAARAAGIEPPARGEILDAPRIRGKPLIRSSRAAAQGDLDGDGDLDLIVANFNHEPYLLRNDSPKGNSLRLKLRGKACNRDGFGSRVKIVAGDRTWNRWLSSSEGYLTQQSKILHVGLGDIGEVERVEVFWPGRRSPQVVRAPKTNQVVEVEQE